MQLPLALPEIMLGVNQTILMALAMIIICAMIGTRDLGQEVFIALSKADSGRGIVAGLAIAFIGIVADRLFGGMDARRPGRGWGRASMLRSSTSPRLALVVVSQPRSSASWSAPGARALRYSAATSFTADSSPSNRPSPCSHGVWCSGAIVPVISER